MLRTGNPLHLHVQYLISYLELVFEPLPLALHDGNKFNILDLGNSGFASSMQLKCVTDGVRWLDDCRWVLNKEWLVSRGTSNSRAVESCANLYMKSVNRSL